MDQRWNERRLNEINSEQDECCSKGHRPSLFLRTGPGGRVCLLCISNLISDTDAFLIHRTYAVNELLMALDDEVFAHALFHSHPKIFVASLSDAIGSSMDQQFCNSIMAVILSLCRLSRDTDESLLEDFMRQIAKQLGSPSHWTSTKSFPLLLIGRLLELHCQQELCLPQAIRNQKDFVINLVVGLQLPGEALQEEIFYVLYKLASLEGGVDQVQLYAGRVCHAALQAVLKTESDSLRINCIALLSVMASSSIFQISLGGGSIPHRDGQVQSIAESVTNGDSTLLTTFAEAMKGSLLSSDLQVQASALRLICSVFPERACLDSELQVLVEGGIVDYVFEVIRVSENQESIQELAMDALILFSAEEHTFPHRFKCGLDTLVRVLAKSIDSHSLKLQTSILQLLSRSLADVTETLSTPRTEQLVLLLSKILQNHAKAVEDHTLIADSNVLPSTFNFACLALISLTDAPCYSSISNVHGILSTATESAIIAASSALKVNPDSCSLIYAVCLLQEVYKKQSVEDEAADDTTEALVGLCELYLLPAFTDNLEKLDDECLILTFLHTFTLILKSRVSDNIHRFASKLTSDRSFTLSFELMGRFPATQVKESAYKFLSSLVDKLSGCSVEVCIEDSMEYLPRDPSDILVQIEQSSAEDQQLLSAHHACIAILSTSYSFDDRLAKETDILASLEQHLLVNRGSSLVPEATLRQFVSLYASAKDVLKGLDAACSAEAENILELVLRHSNCPDLLCSETPIPVLRWFLRRESLSDVSSVQLLAWFTALQNKCFGDAPQQISNSGFSSQYPDEEPTSKFLARLAKLIGDEDCGTTVLVSVFGSLVAQGIDDAISIVAKTFSQLVRMNVLVGQQLVQHGLISTLQQLIRNYRLKETDSTLTSCLELLFQLLYDANPSHEILVDRLWSDIANQCANLVLRTRSSHTTVEVVVPLSVINLILQKSYESDFFAQSSEVLVCNRDLCGKLEALILDASSKGAELSQMESKSKTGELLCAAVIFTLLRLRCALRFEHQIGDLACEKRYIGFEASLNRDGSATGSKLSSTSLTCEHWCRILYFGPPSLKTLASCCLLEIFSQLPDTSNLSMNDSMRLGKCYLPNGMLTAVVMVLQGSVLSNSGRNQKIAGYCLYRLLQTDLTLQQKQAVATSPWNQMLLENLVMSLSTAHLKQIPETARSPANFAAAYVAVGLLKMSRPQPYFSALFSHSSITDMISNLCEDDISAIIVTFFHELLLSNYLKFEHVRILRELFQAAKRKTYARGSTLHLGPMHSKSGFVCSDILNAYHDTDHTIHSAILELAITARDGVVEIFSNDDEHSGAFTSLLDTFMKDSHLQFN